MNIKTPFVFLAMVCGIMLLSCASTPNAPSIQPGELTGTKWVSTMPFMGFSNTIEFIDGENCVYTLITGQKELTYRIKGNSIIIGRDQYFLEGNTFYYKNNPHWIKQE
jgi:hypothetical protein